MAFKVELSSSTVTVVVPVFRMFRLRPGIESETLVEELVTVIPLYLKTVSLAMPFVASVLRFKTVPGVPAPSLVWSLKAKALVVPGLELANTRRKGFVALPSLIIEALTPVCWLLMASRN